MTRCLSLCCFFFSSRRRHTRYIGDWSSDVCSSDLRVAGIGAGGMGGGDLATLARLGVNVVALCDVRSEERRVGKECRSRGSAYHEKKKAVTATNLQG